MNVISSDPVKCLGLKVKKHRTPNRVSWVNKENPSWSSIVS
jgi:ribosomal protein L24E